MNGRPLGLPALPVRALLLPQPAGGHVTRAQKILILAALVAAFVLSGCPRIGGL